MYLGQVKDSSAFWGTVSPCIIIHGVIIIILWRKKTVHGGPLSLCSGAAFI